ncbi:hypothetical protein [Altererythrobacter sp. GH1-8]|uniref:hypothetical protein n=1 Tax=Altererythrobacter sp. GH1-8 TaxID=3349333 RepID=UPI00374CAA2D
MKPPNEMGPGAATPKPQNIAFVSNAVFLYSEHYQHGNQNEQWLVVPRTAVEDAIETAIDWLDRIDQQSDCQCGKAEVPENAL